MTQNDIERVSSVKNLDYLYLMREIEDFLYLEADVLDARDWERWLTFFDDNLRYWMPIRKNLAFANRERDATDDREISWFDNDKDLLERRVRQLLTGIHWAEEPVSRVSHVVTNIRLDSPVQEIREGDVVDVRSHFIVYRNRLETETDILFGRREDKIKRVSGELKITSRRVLLDQHTLTAKNLAFPLF
ncbi:3-phenylpropionate/cinnamic acid dioxygenase subunit beta [Sphingobium phenoxybenzoativorans]|uniref:3-phenylpropionate/cinnamic acid dioxygenase subunit beta n=2 Tax=Sphingobium phenoxybenzoativorans TaxID=1592790 RepID=A0A975KC33_9SPHN|nr:3-phenylpropionate/cinnamic acid dioxygenase subunit beta [Sphingobium phenoxybenzoativorans]